MQQLTDRLQDRIPEAVHGRRRRRRRRCRRCRRRCRRCFLVLGAQQLGKAFGALGGTPLLLHLQARRALFGLEILSHYRRHAREFGRWRGGGAGLSRLGRRS